MTRASEGTVFELAMMVRMLVSSLKRYDAGHPVAAQATRLLVDRGLMRGNGLRDEYVRVDHETLARSADQVEGRLAASDMVPLDSQDGISVGRNGELMGPGGGPVLALDAGPGRGGLVGPRWQFEPALQTVLGAIAAELDSTGWDLLSFLETPHGDLEGYTPRQAIEQGHADRVLRIAKAEGY